MWSFPNIPVTHKVGHGIQSDNILIDNKEFYNLARPSRSAEEQSWLRSSSIGAPEREPSA